MLIFETILLLMFGAAILSMLARRWNMPYPTLLALGGIAVAFVPGMPKLDLPPDLILALFVAPVLLDASHDTSLRELRQNWRAVSSLVLIAVVLTTLAVAVTARWFLPAIPWGAAIALGALLAPPDAVAALAVLRQVKPPHRIRSILEGEGLLNDASSLLIYKLALAAVLAGGFQVADAVPAFALVIFGSVAAGWILAKITVRLLAPIRDPSTATIMQFVTTFGVWILAERFQLSGVITIVVFGLTAARRRTSSSNSHVRVPSNSNWVAMTFVLNVLAFTLIGLQVRPIFERLDPAQRAQYLGVALLILAVVVIVRLAWVLAYGFVRDQARSAEVDRGVAFRSRLVVGWSGMRGVVTVAAALAIPVGFPYRDFILLTALTVVLGTLVVQGLTLGPLLSKMRLPPDDTVERELAIARSGALQAALAELRTHDGEASQRLQCEYGEALRVVDAGGDPRTTGDNALRQAIIPASRRAIDALRDDGKIGDDAYRAVEEELDLLELSARVPEAPP